MNVNSTKDEKQETLQTANERMRVKFPFPSSFVFDSLDIVTPAFAGKWYEYWWAESYALLMHWHFIKWKLKMWCELYFDFPYVKGGTSETCLMSHYSRFAAWQCNLSEEKRYLNYCSKLRAETKTTLEEFASCDVDEMMMKCHIIFSTQSCNVHWMHFKENFFSRKKIISR